MRILFIFSFLFLLVNVPMAQTWNGEVGCLVYSHCSNCHRPGGIGPFSLMSYFEAFQHREMISQSVQSRMMPPFPPDQRKRQYAHANTLTKAEIDAIVSWAGNNAPLGSGTEPSPPQFTDAAEIGDPDVVRQIPAYTVNTPAKDDYRVFVLPVGNTAEKFIEAVEVVPGNREIVHHVLVFSDTSQIPLQLDAADPGPGYSAFGSSGSPSAVLFSGYVPGQKAYFYPPGFGARLLPNSYLCLQIHYPKGLSNETDSTSIRIRYRSSSTGVRELLVLPALNHSNSLLNGPLLIPANTVKTFYSQAFVPLNFTLTGISPHMHLLGKSIRAYGLKPNGDTIHLIDIPEWHFHWQGFYNFKKPILLPQGTILKGEATYDNTISNVNNPHSPPQLVGLGEGTTDEMMLITFFGAPFQVGDTSIIIDQNTHWTHDSLSCSGITTGRTVITKPEWNNISEFLSTESPQRWALYQSDGRLLYTGVSSSLKQTLKLQKLNPGFYCIRTEESGSGRIQSFRFQVN